LVVWCSNLQASQLFCFYLGVPLVCGAAQAGRLYCSSGRYVARLAAARPCAACITGERSFEKALPGGLVWRLSPPPLHIAHATPPIKSRAQNFRGFRHGNTIQNWAYFSNNSTAFSSWASRPFMKSAGIFLTW
jgi:hypothetical protein